MIEFLRPFQDFSRKIKEPLNTHNKYYSIGSFIFKETEDRLS